MESNLLFTVIVKCWIAMENERTKDVLRYIPTILIWELCKRRNQIKNGKQVPYFMLKDRGEKTFYQLIRSRYPRWVDVPKRWIDSLDRIRTVKGVCSSK